MRPSRRTSPAGLATSVGWLAAGPAAPAGGVPAAEAPAPAADAGTGSPPDRVDSAALGAPAANRSAGPSAIGDPPRAVVATPASAAGPAAVAALLGAAP